MKHADPKVIWLAGSDPETTAGLANRLQHHCRSRSIPAMVVDESQTGGCDKNECADGSGRLCRLAKSLAEQGYPVIVAASHRDTLCQAWNRAHLPGYFEVHLESGRDTGQQVPVVPDMRLHGESREDGVCAEAIFEEVFGRGQIIPALEERSVLPSAGIMPAVQSL